jgi:hypothetical protein
MMLDQGERNRGRCETSLPYDSLNERRATSNSSRIKDSRRIILFTAHILEVYANFVIVDISSFTDYTLILNDRWIYFLSSLSAHPISLQSFPPTYLILY